ncbi:DUF5617 domain-containing protein [Legionella clemsonensis]|uniref:RavJ-like C-terminal domain-containing protein n=1 Tax=Legionella clemsonensis TaxID=1867846 RepID=A0A222P4V7_9GAMM|nr:DUF5617 domain-containing protein [Legionella clemsonensis]ASQ46876.1 hypothetical protein clem_11695 [Legionella clemsonensis]
MPLLSDIDISDYQTVIAEKISLLIDPVLHEIPQDPVFVNYFHPEKCGVRLFSKTQMQLLQQQNEEYRRILDELKEDRTGIYVALKHAENLSVSEQRYKAFFLKMKDLTSQRIMVVLKELYQMALFINSPLAYVRNLLKLSQFLYKNIAAYFQEFEVLTAEEGDAEQTIVRLWRFFNVMFMQQTEISAMIHKQLTSDGLPLTKNQIFCPYSKERIRVAESLRTGNQASNFLAIFIALSQFAGLKDLEIQNFLTMQPSNYLEQANKKLLQYLRLPIWFNFSPRQQCFLAEAGARAVAQQLHYRHLWSEENKLQENALSLLIDYNKQDWQSPSFGLFITGHWRRHHYGPVNEAIHSLKKGEEVPVVLAKLKEQIQHHPHYNPEGSLVNRLEFIEHKLALKAKRLPVDSALVLS